MIFPEQLSPQISIAPLEREYHGFFKKMGNDFRIYHSMRLITPDVPLRECDFVVLSNRGIYFIELKTGKWQKEQNGPWLFQNTGRDGQPDPQVKPWLEVRNKPYSNPIEQVEGFKNIFLKFLANHGFSGKLNSQLVHTAVILHNNQRQELFINQAEKTGLAFGDELMNSGLEPWLRQMQKTEARLGEQEQKQIAEIIESNLNYVRKFSKRREFQQKEMLALTENQYAVLQGFFAQKRQLISGVAGSGKTLVAVEAARRLAAQGKKVLMLCHSSNLAIYLAELLADCRENVTVETRTSLCNRLIHPVDPDFGKRKEKADSGEENKKYPDRAELSDEEKWENSVYYFKKVMPQKALEYADHWQHEKVDALILDEAQDLLSIEEVLLFDALLKGGLEQGEWLVVYDEAQTVWGEIKDGLDYLLGQKPHRLSLAQNIRTPQTVYALAEKIRPAGSQTAGRLPDTTGVQFAFYKNAEEASSRLKQMLDYFIDQMKFLPHQIMIVSPVKRTPTLGLGGSRKTGNYTIKNFDKNQITEGQVGFCEIARYKGLETPVVILMGLEHLLPGGKFASEQKRAEFYIALTRTTSAAGILLPESLGKILTG